MSISYIDACDDPNLFLPWFEGDSWRNWRVIDKAIFGLPLDPDELPIFTELTGRTEAPTEPVREVWLAFGRRTAKTLKAASYAVYLATIGAEAYGYRDRLAPGERGVVQVLAVDRDQASIALEYVRAFFEQPMLARMVKRETSDSIELDNSMVIEVTTNDRRRVRGRTVIAAIFDEVGHWRSESSVSPDEDVYQSIKPSMTTIPNALLIGISSPYARKGLLWRKVNEFYAKPGRTLVARAPTWTMNPLLPRDHPDIEQAFADDRSWAEAEFGGEFRTDIESFASREAVEAVTDWRTFEREPLQGVRYTGFLDPSGGSRDSMVAAVGHAEGEIGMLDAIREIKAPFSPASAIVECVDLFKRYNVKAIFGDQYAVQWVQEPLRQYGIAYKPCDPKSTIYMNFLPLLNSGRVRLLGNRRLVNQLLALERTTPRGSNRDSIDHPRGGDQFDDVINAAAGCLVYASVKRPRARMGTFCPVATPGDPNSGMIHWHDEEPQTRIRVERISEQEDLKRRGLL